MNVFIIEDRPSLDDLLDSAIDAFKSEYDEVDIYPRSEIRRIEHITTVQQQLEFVTHDLVSQVHLFGYRTGRVGVLLMYQGYDEDMKLYQNMLEAIRNTMTIEFGDQDIIT